MFDPYYVEELTPKQGVIQVKDQPFRYNRIVDMDRFNRESKEMYELGPVEDREAVIIYNEKTRKTAEDTIEYFI